MDSHIRRIRFVAREFAMQAMLLQGEVYGRGKGGHESEQETPPRGGSRGVAAALASQGMTGGGS